MRIICQKCAAAYAIDDRVITPKGVRAQCPRCRHLQLVKREDSPAVAESKPAAAAPKPAASPARPATPSASLSDSLFGDLGDLEPAPEPNEAPANSLLNELEAIGRPSTPAAPVLEKDSLFGDLAELTQSSPSNPTIDIGASSKPAPPSYSIPSGDLLFD
ncbi:MAG TPA: zinc-ribbon domain-containing protein, partial [Cystobacter sp.]